MPGRTRINNPKTIAMTAPPTIKVSGLRAFKAIFLSAYEGPSHTYSESDQKSGDVSG